MSDALSTVFGHISGELLERQLIELAAISNEPDQQPLPPTSELPIRYATSRVALTEADIRARAEFVQPLMEQLGGSIHIHPLGTLAIFEGNKPELAPLVIMSRTDTVPEGDMYDGTTGVLGGLAAISAIQQAGVTLDRTVILAAVTGEESSGFGTALFGSKGMFIGLSPEDLAAHKVDQPSIGEVLGESAIEAVTVPIFGDNDGALFPQPHAVLELHVEQNDVLQRKNIDLGVVDRIAAPVRHDIVFSSKEPLEVSTVDHEKFPFTTYLELTFNGKSDHSGARAMGDEFRADGLVEAAHFTIEALRSQEELQLNTLSVGDINVFGGAVNKVPGRTTVNLRLQAKTDSELKRLMVKLNEITSVQSEIITTSMPKFANPPITLREIEQTNAGVFFKPDGKTRQVQKNAMHTVTATNRLARAAAAKSVVGTIGEIVTEQNTGAITLTLDLRGITESSRDVVFYHISDFTDTLQTGAMQPRKPGGADVVHMDPELVRTAQRVINKYDIGTSQVMFSPAGHDVQNSARAGVPSLLMFVPSQNEGIAHEPDAYTTPEHLEKGVKALAAMIVELAS